MKFPAVLAGRAWAASFVTCVSVIAAHAAEPPHALQGYGRVSLEVVDRGSGPLIFRCVDEAAADRLLSKLLADFTWDRLTGPRRQVVGQGVTALEVGPQSLLLLARQENAVHALAGSTPAALRRQMATLGLDYKRTSFSPRRRHPMALDFFDLRAVSMYYLPLNVLDLADGLHRYDARPLGQTSEFWRASGYGHSFFGPYFGFDELADGAGHFFPHEWMIRQATGEDLIVMSHIGQYAAPWWMRNRFSRDIVGWDPYAISGWNPLEAMGGTYLSQHAGSAAYAYARRFAAQALDSLATAAGDHLGCFREAAGGHPGDELALHHASTEFMDYDEAGQKAFRRWLQEARGLDLASLGRRWSSDPGRYHSWDEVTLPSQFEFFGGFGKESSNLLSGWLWRPDSPQAEADGWHRSDYRPDGSWTPTDLAPSLKQLLLFGSTSDAQLRQGKSMVAWFRKEFDASAWMAAQPGGDVYLVAAVGDAQNEPVEVYLNGNYLGPIHPQNVQSGSIAFRATKLLRPGRNVLCLKVHGGLIRGPVFLTRQEPRRYPYLGRQENARWVDLRDWTAEKLVSGWKRGAGPSRQAAPDVPLLFCPGSSLELSDQFLGLKRELGIEAIHFTGGGSGYMPWWAGLGYVWGAYGTSEEGGTITDPQGLDNELAWMLLNGQGHHNYYYSSIDCMRIEEKTGWFSRNRRLLELLGKANWVRPEVAVFRSARNDLYFPQSTSLRGSDLGLGALQAAHYGNVYVTEAEIRAGLVRGYPVIIDAGNSVIDDATLRSLEEYVRQGGAYVAVENTGRHEVLEPDTWPIARLTGMRVTGLRDGARLEVSAGCRQLSRLAGSAFQGSGLSLAPQKTGKDADQPEVLARWSDGTAAATIRRLGRGRVVLLGSGFWRSDSDRTADGRRLGQSLQTILLSDLFAGLGVRRQVDADSEDAWVRRFVTKNGLQQWVVAYNAGRGPIQELAIRLPCQRRPQRVVDVVSGKQVEFTWRDGEVCFAGLPLAPRAVRVLAVDTPDPLEAVSHWFAEKCRYEERGPAIKAQEEPVPPATAIVFRDFRFRPAGRAADDAGWLDEPTDRKPWQPLGYGFWDEQGQPAHGIGFYRQEFCLPEMWRGKRVLLGCMSYDYPVFLENAEFFVNGHAAGQYRGHAWANFDVLDITPHLMPGENRLAVRVEASQVRGGYLGQLVIYPLETLDDARDLRTGWRLFEDNLHSQAATLPLKAEGRHIETDVAFPAGWQGKEIYLEFEVADRWVGLIVVNGRVIAYNQSQHPFPNIMQVNLYPWAKPGKTNRIEFWPRMPDETPRLRMVVERVRVGTVGPPREAASAVAVDLLPELPADGDRRSAPLAASGGREQPAPSQAAAEAGTTPPAAKPGPIIFNGGFERWSPLSPQRQGEDMVKNVVLTPDHLAPDGWIPGRELGKQPGLTGKITPDRTVRHAGQCSACLQNGDARDITVLEYSTERGGGQAAILPNHRYRMHWWVKGEQVRSADAGPILLMNVVSAKKGQEYRVFGGEQGPLPRGTFDWQPRELTFITDAFARAADFSFQLRWSRGVIWYDDVELEDMGPVVPVETY